MQEVNSEGKEEIEWVLDAFSFLLQVLQYQSFTSTVCLNIKQFYSSLSGLHIVKPRAVDIQT